MTWTGKLWRFGKTPQFDEMNALQADITAKADGDTGAPKNQVASMDTNSVGTSALVAGAVSQSKIPTGQGSAIISLGGDVISDWTTLPGGNWGFYPQIKVNTLAIIRSRIMVPLVEAEDPPDPPETTYFSSTSYLTTIGAAVSSGVTSMTFTAQQRYIQASPPYDLGDGLCHRFTFCKINKTTGDIEGVWTAPDAPWHNNGPTDIRRSRWKFILDGDGYDHRQLYSDAMHIKRLVAIGGDLTDRQFARLQQWFSVMPLLDKISVNEDVAQSVKNADMAIIPHPFSPSRKGCEVVLLDPMSDVSAMLNEIEDDGEKNIAGLVFGGFFKISNSTLSRISPPGVKTVSYRWK